MKYDVIVIGAGPAGSVAAKYAVLGGAKTLLIEKKKDIGIPVQCGEFLPSVSELKRMLPKVSELDELFDVPEKIISRRLKKICIVSPNGKKYDFDFDGMTIERRLFDRHLAVRAAEAGAEVLVDTSFLGIKNGKVLTTRGEFDAGVIVGADGPVSRVAKAAGLETPKTLSPCVSCEVAGDFGDAVEMYFGAVAPEGYAWVIPKRETANIGLGVQRGIKREPMKVLLEKFVNRVAQKRSIVFYTSGVVPMGGPISRTVRDNVMIVGDAAGHVIASNGGGIPIAMVCGRIAGRVAAAHVLSGTPLEEYEKEWRQSVMQLLWDSLQTKKLASPIVRFDEVLEGALVALGLTESVGKMINQDGLISRGIKGKSLVPNPFLYLLNYI